jgi:4-amino-4-deoxy-L-arabinose transferase-like glycosyltransferase
MVPLKRDILVLFVIAVVLRVSGIYISEEDGFGVDTREYLSLAQNIHFHGAFSFGQAHPWGIRPSLDSAGPYMPTAARAPLYPLTIASLWWSNEAPILKIQILQAILGGLTVILVYLISIRLTNRKVGLTAALLAALSPLSIITTSSVMSETLFTFLLILGIWLWSLQRGVSAGITFGLAALTRPVMLPFIILIALLALFFNFNRRLHTKIAFFALLTLAPWTIRNAVTFDSFIPIQTYGWGANLLLGTIEVPYGTGGYVWESFNTDKDFEASKRSEPTEAGAEKKMLQIALSRIKTDPIGWFWLRVKQYPRLFADTGTYLFKHVPIQLSILKLTTLILGIIFFAFSFLGAFLVRRKLAAYYSSAAFPIYMLIMQFPVFGEVRFLAPILPLLAIFAAIPLSELLFYRSTFLIQLPLFKEPASSSQPNL